MSPVVFVAVFSEPVAGFGDGDVILGGTAGATTAVVSGGPSSCTMTVSGMTQSGRSDRLDRRRCRHRCGAEPEPGVTSTDNTVAFVFSIAISTRAGRSASRRPAARVRSRSPHSITQPCAARLASPPHTGC
ncbi:MAG: hypothetical protein R2694_07935 [Ilumatobacteraceae bacterium]